MYQFYIEIMKRITEKINSKIATYDHKVRNQAKDSSMLQMVITTTLGPNKHDL